jgi:hypothetical protein
MRASPAITAKKSPGADIAHGAKGIIDRIPDVVFSEFISLEQV